MHGGNNDKPRSSKLEQVLSEWTLLLAAVCLSVGDTNFVCACFTIRDDVE
jgi:hypothetical protein